MISLRRLLVWAVSRRLSCFGAFEFARSRVTTMPAAIPWQTSPIVKAPAGPVEGRIEGALRVFKGIPYALPPVGCGALETAQPDAARGRASEKQPSSGPHASSPRPAAVRISTQTIQPPMSEDCLTLNIWAPADARNAPVFFWIHGGALIGRVEQRALYDGARLASARHRRGLHQLSAGCTRLAGASRTQRRVAAWRIRQLWLAGSDRGAAMGPAQHRRLRRRSFERDHRRRIRGRPQRDVPHGSARRSRPVLEGHRGKRVHDLHARAETSADSARRLPRRAVRSLAAALHAPDIARIAGDGCAGR